MILYYLYKKEGRWALPNIEVSLKMTNKTTIKKRKKFKIQKGILEVNQMIQIRKTNTVKINKNQANKINILIPNMMHTNYFGWRVRVMSMMKTKFMIT